MLTETLDGEEVKLPEEITGKYTLIGLAYSKKAEEDLNSWQVPTYNKFVAKTGLMDDMFDVGLFFIPMFTGAKKMVKDKIIREIEDNTDSRVRKNILIYSGEADPVKEALKLREKDQPYFFLLNPQGKIVWRGSGRFKQSYFDEIEAILTR